MGLDMSIYRMKRCNGATLNDAWAVAHLLDFEQYKRNHPDYTKSLEEWCGYDLPKQEYIDFYSKLADSDKYGFIHTTEEVAYWRKANAIHKWFVENVQDGEDDCDAHRELTISDLQKLRELARQVLEDPDKADDLLPTQSGFFFGDTAYDEWYFDDLRDTIKMIDTILASTDFNTEALYYVSSW
jgi:hypothetical protein